MADEWGAAPWNTGAQGGGQSPVAPPVGHVQRPSPQQFRPGHDDWDDRPGAAANEAVARPPIVWLAVGVGLAVIGAVLGLVFRSATWSVLGWLLSGPAAIGMLAVFALADAAKRQRLWYVPGQAAGWLRRSLVVLALMAIAVNAWIIADAVARGRWT